MEREGKVVLVAVDLNTHRNDAIRAVLDLEGANPRSVIHLLGVLDPHTLGSRADQRVVEQEEEYLARTPTSLEQRAALFVTTHARAQPRAKVVGHARIGAVVPTIMQACVDYDVDLLICGTRGRAGVRRVLRGAVAESLIREARGPVLVACPKSYDGLLPTKLPDPPPAPGTPPPHALASRTEGLVGSTTFDGWEAAHDGPTGVRIV